MDPTPSEFVIRSTSIDALIADGTAETAEVDLAGTSLTAIVVPSGWTAANLTFQVSADGTTYADLYSATGSEYVVDVPSGGDCAITVPPLDFEGFRRMKVRSGTSGTPVNQTGAKTLTLICRPTF
ncbi:MAG: hypothetical protein KGL39_41380 [Patescibacteria group bacterium]|nr:hypothetical protein [Patescibacteria group bacterium]